MLTSFQELSSYFEKDHEAEPFFVDDVVSGKTNIKVNVRAFLFRSKRVETVCRIRLEWPYLNRQQKNFEAFKADYLTQTGLLLLLILQCYQEPFYII